MLYNTGTIAINGNTATGTGTNWTAPASQIRVGQTLFVLSNPVQMFQITAINSATSLTVTPAASPALNGQKYGILVTDSLSVDGLAQSMSQLINEYDENIGAWETFATTSANQNITVTINGARVTIPAIGKLVQKRSNGAVGVSDGGTGATDADIARTNLYAAKSGENEDITLIRGLKGRAQLWTDTDYSTGCEPPHPLWQHLLMRPVHPLVTGLMRTALVAVGQRWQVQVHNKIDGFSETRLALLARQMVT
ncbi:hypothetical protein [Enterobacter hormaechei]|uniref:hypothetical protein n=1 Tax=Enterobacter hormaechei TaxID=158836 RepID=UPI001F4B84B2|nr:hypothetical protein [Enterobacter hormaechei]